MNANDGPERQETGLEGVRRGGFGEQVRTRRQRAGLSLQDLAERIGCAKGYLSEIETGRRNAPGEEMVRRFEEALGVLDGAMARAAALERGLAAGGEALRDELSKGMEAAQAWRRVATGVKRAGGVGTLDDLYRTGALAKIVAEAEKHGGQEPLNPTPSQGVTPIALPLEVPLINKVVAGYPREFTDLSYPARVADEYIRCPDLNDPDAFAARVVGDSMQPNYREGDIVVFSPATPVKSGMDVFARLEPDHETTFKRVYFEKPRGGEELIRLQPLNSKYPPRTLERERVAGLYAAVSVMRKLV
ncbi:MAG: helix-turn-helix domain-containing protein [Tepidisphaera sp.]|nr:helix-turn-helix domain-containing protein [Tepidisphaera sp.]